MNRALEHKRMEQELQGNRMPLEQIQLMEDALHKCEREFRSIAENSPDAIARFDRECRYLYVNPALQRLTGKPADALLGRTPLEVNQRNASYVGFDEKLREALSTGRATELELFVDDLPGSFRPISDHIRFTPEFGPDGSVVSVLAIGRDIGSLKKTQQHLMKSQALLQALAARQEKDGEQERKRIAWEVHEELGQTLMALRLNLRLLNEHLSGRDALVEAYMESSAAMLDHSIQVIRDVVPSLRPSVLDLGIEASLEWLAEKFIERTGIPVELRLGEQAIAMNDDYATATFRIAQEALENVCRHARATEVGMTLERRGNDYILEVRDNGTGFDLDMPQEKALGLLGMRVRAQRLGGKLEITSAAAKGTAIKASIPLICT